MVSRISDISIVSVTRVGVASDHGSNVLMSRTTLKYMYGYVYVPTNSDRDSEEQLRKSPTNAPQASSRSATRWKNPSRKINSSEEDQPYREIAALLNHDLSAALARSLDSEESET